MEHNDRITLEIVDEVKNKILEEGMTYGIDREMANSIYAEWLVNLETLKREPNEKKVFLNVKDDSNSTSCSEEGFINRLESDVENYVVCFYNKVTRSKLKWKCSFKHGFVNVDNEDIPFSTATGELIQW